MTIGTGNVSLNRFQLYNQKTPPIANTKEINRSNIHPVQSRKETFTISFHASKSMKRLRQMIKDETKQRNEASKRKAEEIAETKRVLKPLPVELANKLNLSENPFKEGFSEGKKLGIAIAYNLRNDATETIIIVNKAGEVLVKNGGSKSSTGVFYSDDKYKDCISIHNHPISCSFSDQDIYSMLNMKIHESIVGTSEGYYSMIIPEEVNRETAYKAIKETRVKYEDCRKENIELVKLKKLTNDEADKKLYKYIDSLWAQTANEMGWEYKFTSWE